jgi:hypothetical protein
MVRSHELHEIYQRWIDRGMPQCTHERSRRLYDDGVPHEDEACTGCGVTWRIGDPKPA